MARISSTPSRKRTLVAGGLFVCFAVLASAIRISRPDFGLLPILAPLDVGATSPNFFVGAACPLISFFPNKSLDFLDFVKIAFGAAVGISIYEVLQIWIPGRTFDVNDIIATFAGAVFGILFCSPLFFRRVTPTGGDRPE